MPGESLSYTTERDGVGGGGLRTAKGGGRRGKSGGKLGEGGGGRGSCLHVCSLVL